MRVILDTRGKTPITARLFQQPGKTLLVHGKIDDKIRAEYTKIGAELLELPASHGRIDLNALLQTLGVRGITSLLVESGGTLLGSLFDKNLVDKVIVFVAPIIIGGTSAKSPVCGDGVEKITDVLKLKRVNIARFGEDVMISGYTS